MKVLVISPKNKTVFNFRGDLIKAMIANGHEVYVIGPNQDFIEDIMALGVTTFIEVPFVKDNVNAFGDFKYCKLLKEKVKEVNPDVVFSYTIKPVIYGSIAASKAGVKHIYPMITGLGRVFASYTVKAKFVRFVAGFLYKYALSNCDKVMFQNNDDLNHFVKLGYVREEKTEHIDGSGVNMSRFEFNGLPENHVFLMTARIIKEKGVFEYCKAARIVKKQYPDARFILLGGYDNSIGAIAPSDIQEYIEDGSIEFPGETKDVVPFLKKCRYFVLPTFYCEGLPRTILEAMAMGRPVITTDWPGCRDAVKDGENGYLVEPQNAEQLADKMILLMTDSLKVQAMSKKAIERCKFTYDVNVINKKMLEIMHLA